MITAHTSQDFGKAWMGLCAEIAGIVPGTDKCLVMNAFLQSLPPASALTLPKKQGEGLVPHLLDFTVLRC